MGTFQTTRQTTFIQLRWLMVLFIWYVQSYKSEGDLTHIVFCGLNWTNWWYICIQTRELLPLQDNISIIQNIDTQWRWYTFMFDPEYLYIILMVLCHYIISKDYSQMHMLLALAHPQAQSDHQGPKAGVWWKRFLCTGWFTGKPWWFKHQIFGDLFSSKLMIDLTIKIDDFSINISDLAIKTSEPECIPCISAAEKMTRHDRDEKACFLVEIYRNIHKLNL